MIGVEQGGTFIVNGAESSMGYVPGPDGEWWPKISVNPNVETSSLGLYAPANPTHLSSSSSAAILYKKTFRTTSGIEVGYTDVPVLPGISFKNRVDNLLVDWYESGHLVIGGQRISIQDWPLVFNGTPAWERFKSTFSKWKVSNFCRDCNVEKKTHR